MIKNSGQSGLVGFLFCSLVCLLAPLSAFAATEDPYNTLIWAADDQSPWYEWWYFKIVEPESRDAYFFTYGVVNPWDDKRSLAGTRAFVMVGDFKNRRIYNQEMPVTQFRAERDRVEVQIGKMFATDQKLNGEMQTDDGHRLRWNIDYQLDWKLNAMGWTMGAPGSGIYWYPAQASARAQGWIEIDGKMHSIKAAPAYQDRNWGRSFPKWWTWITSNHFQGEEDATLAVGGGQPQLLGGSYAFQGLCIGLRLRGHEYVFRSIDIGHNVEFDIRWGKWHISAQNASGEAIEIDADAPAESFLDLPFATPKGEIFHDYEALLGHVKVKLYYWSSPSNEWRERAHLESDEAGIEWGTPKLAD
jgi:Tocopherol cyclase